jgi:ribosomal protein S18 acetylase RimI-like enzyme
MAVSPALQGRGVGSRLVTWALDHARSLAAYEIVWCNARTPAVNFYSRLGFERVADEFVTEWGPHYLMFRYL